MGSVSKYEREVLVAAAPGAVRVERKNFIALAAPVAPETPNRQIVANNFHHLSSLLSGGRLWRSEFGRPPAGAGGRRVERWRIRALYRARADPRSTVWLPLLVVTELIRRIAKLVPNIGNNNE